MRDVAFVFRPEACRGCGRCADSCAPGLIVMEDGKPRHLPGERCRQCFHCVASCPTGAADVEGFPQRTVAADSPLLSRRSCRRYLQEPVDREVLRNCAVVADQAPRMSMPGARRYLFVTEPASLLRIRAELGRSIRAAHRLFRLLAAMPLPAGMRGRLRQYRDTFAIVARSGKDILHGAPVLVLVTGRKAEGMGREDAIYALHQLLLAAEAAGLCGCVNGFVSGFPAVVQRALGLPKDTGIWAAATLGIPAVRSSRVVLRDDLDVQWA